MLSLRKFCKGELSSNYNSKAILDLFDISDNHKLRLENANKFIKTLTPNNKSNNKNLSND
jgi:hypothetical protein